MNRQPEDVHGSGVYPATGPYPPGGAVVRSPAAFGHPEERTLRRSRTVIETPAFFVGRVIFGGYFLYNGINHFLNREMLTGYARSKGVPAAGLAVPASGLLIIAGGLSILAGVRPKMGAGLIGTFLLGVSPWMHAFWKEREPEPRMQELVNFTKNIALVGASLLAAAHREPWPWRLPRRAGGALVPVRS